MDSGTVFRFLLYVIVAYLAVRWFITMMLVYSRREKTRPKPPLPPEYASSARRGSPQASQELQGKKS